MKKPEQARIWQTDDLPLFSGTSPHAELETVGEQPAAKQEPLPFKCRFCADTGLLGEYAFCWCEAGRERRKTRERERSDG